MKDKILKLRSEGKTYDQIKAELGCSKSTISFHCGIGQKEKNRERARRNKKFLLFKKVESFQRIFIKNTGERVRRFNKKDGQSTRSEINPTFNVDDVIKKFGVTTICYLSGEEIDLFKDLKIYHFDHIVPATKGGSNLIDNLGIAHKVPNVMKSDLMVDELLEWCKKILKHNGYYVKKKTASCPNG